MRGRIWVVLVLGLFAAGLAAGAIKAGPTAPPTTTGDTTTDVSTDVTTTVPSVETTTTGATTTSATTTQSTPPRTVIGPTAPPGGHCLVVAAFALLEPDGQVRVLGEVVASANAHDLVGHGVAYPADGSVLTASAFSLHAGRCSPAANGRAEVRSVSLFGGALSARSIELRIHGTDVTGGSGIEGLTIAGRAATLRAGHPLPIGVWGYVLAPARPDPAQAGTLAVQLSKRHAGLAAGTIVLVSFARLPRVKAAAPLKAQSAVKAKPALQPQRHQNVQHRAKPSQRHRRHTHKRPGEQPLTVTPPLGIGHYVFPVAGESSYIDTYGAFRGDVPGNWHHGDDIFAPLGTPVLAVADGTLNRVGWERLGGWRLWVRDSMRNEFYYAHLSGYSPLALHSKRVRAGDVIGFIGNTGDAFTTSPHLHFEIHPHQLLRLDYNGAVDPTHYLDGWQHFAHPRAPKPAHPRFPAGEVRSEARYVWRQLLAARGLIAHAPRLSERPRISIPGVDHVFPDRRMAVSSALRAGHRSRGLALDVLVGLVAPAMFFGAALLVRLRRRPTP